MQKREKILRFVRVLSCLLWLAVLVVIFVNRKNLTVEQILSLIPQSYLPAFAVLMALFALKSLSVFVFGGLLFAACGALFEPSYLALAVSMAGALVMAIPSYFLGAFLWKNHADELVAKNKKAAAVRDFRGGSDFVFSLMTRLLGLPYDLVSMYMGAANVSFPKYLAGSFLGTLPNIFIYTLLGIGAAHKSTGALIATAVLQVLEIALSLLYLAVKRERWKRKKAEENKKEAS